MGANMPESYRLLGCRGCGSVIVEAAFRVAEIPYDYEEVDYDEPGPARDRLFTLNPLGQVPTLVLPDGAVMTESAAIVLMVDDKVPEAGLVPPPGAPERNAFLRWLVFMVASVYPTFTYGDSPKKWLPDAADATALRTATDRRREMLWRYVEGEVDPRPWFLGARFSALDLYMAAMVHWRPRADWFARECPKLAAVAAEAARLPAVESLFREQFD
jgi:GST-like protein